MIEEGADIGVEDPVDLACLDSSQELRLVDRREEGDHGCLDDLVLDGSNAERPLSAIRFRYVLPAGARYVPA